MPRTKTVSSKTVSLKSTKSMEKLRWVMDVYLTLTPEGQRAIDSCLTAFPRVSLDERADETKGGVR
jgi:hypothetical protein